jgi:diadenosine tetraphosphate (Ap4A) HIT family hydrolase
VSGCVFCPDNWDNLDIVERWMPGGPAGSVAIIRPLNPVTPGHTLVIHRDHDESAAASRDASRRACLLMAVAADYVNVNGLQANIITSIGPAASQTVMHTHLHIVPRTEGDGLHLPWTGQH